MTNPIRTALERLLQHIDDPIRTPFTLDAAIAAARSALATDGPAVPESREPASVVGEPSDEELLSLWGQAILGLAKGSTQAAVNLAFARAVLARYGHQPTPPAEGEVAELAAKLRRIAPHNPLGTADPTITRAAELLQQQHPTPVPVSEGLPEPEDCDAEGRCWYYTPVSSVLCAYWVLRQPDSLRTWETHWLPAHALPLPQGEVEG